MKQRIVILLAVTLFCIGLTGLNAQTVTDIDGNVYNTVNIGAQTWTAEDLKTTKYNDGTNIPLVTDGVEFLDLTTPAYCWYLGDSATFSNIYGALYNRHVVNTGKLCPTGWHVSTDNEWKQMEMYLGMSQIEADSSNYYRGTNEGGKLKDTGSKHWCCSNIGATNESGFTALPGGDIVDQMYAWGGVCHHSSWWSLSEANPNCYRSLSIENDGIGRFSFCGDKNCGYSVRCLKDISDTAPTANFTALPTNLIEGQNVKFNDHSTNGPTSWNWSFGDGGTSALQNPSYTYSIAGTYTVTLTASNGFGTDSETKTGFIAVSATDVDTIIFNPNLTYGTMTDINGNNYKTIQICAQTWMAENLKTTKFNYGTNITNLTNSSKWQDWDIAAYCWYNNDSAAYANKYGALYNGKAVYTGKLCPKGWHVPTDDEWTILTTCLGGDIIVGNKLKETGTIHWSSPNTVATNESGFTALPGGYRDYCDGVFYNHTNFGLWWSSTEYNFMCCDLTWLRYMINNSSDVTRYFNEKKNGFSVRCLKDDNASKTNSISSKEVILYPNPATDKLYLKNSNYANSTIMIFDLQGKQVLSKQMDSNPIDISGIEKGIYVVKLVCSENVLISKFIKE